MTPLVKIFWMVALALMWSPSFLLIKLAIPEISPLTLAATRISMGAVLLLILLLAIQRPLPLNFTFWKRAAFMGIFSSAIPFSLFPFAERSIESALAAVLNGCNPMFTALIAYFFMPSDKMSPQKISGVLLCFLGLVSLFYPALSDGIDGSILGMMAATFAAFSYGISHVYGKKHLSDFPLFVVPAAHLLVSSLVLWPLAFIFETPVEDLSSASNLALFGVFSLGFLGTFLALIIYYKLLKESGPTAISAIACVFPVIAMFLGFFFLGESLTLNGLIAAAMIFLGLFLVNEMIPERVWQKQKD